MNVRLKEGPFTATCPHCGTGYDVPAGMALILETPEETPRARFRAWAANGDHSLLLHECAHGVPVEQITQWARYSR